MLAVGRGQITSDGPRCARSLREQQAVGPESVPPGTAIGCGDEGKSVNSKTGRQRRQPGPSRTEVEVVVESVTITDNRNGQTIEIPIVDGGIAADQWASSCPAFGSTTLRSWPRLQPKAQSLMWTATTESSSTAAIRSSS